LDEGTGLAFERGEQLSILGPGSSDAAPDQGRILTSEGLAVKGAIEVAAENGLLGLVRWGWFDGAGSQESGGLFS